MSTTVNTGWLKDNTGEKFAPKTLSSQIITNDGESFDEEIKEYIDTLADVELTKAQYDALGDSVLTDGKTYFITDIDGESGGSGGTIIANTDGVVINVEIGNWVEQSDGTYINTIDVENVSINDVYDISLYGDYSEEQAYAFDFLVTSIDTYNGQVVLTASEEITVAFSIILRGRVNLENKNVYVSDLSATSISYDNSESNMAATDMQNAIDELATSVNGFIVNVTADSWDLQEDGTYRKIISVEQLTGNEILDVCLYPGETHTEEQITAYSELINSIETEEGRIILIASEIITVGFKILLYGRIGFNIDVVESEGNGKAITLTQEEYDALSEEEKSSGIYVISDAEDLTAKNLAYDGSLSGLGNNTQDAIDNLAKIAYIVEEDDIEDVHYRKWSNGTMEQWLNRVTTDVSIATAYSGVWYWGEYIWNFPIAFTNSPTVTIGIAKWGTSLSFGTFGSANATSAAIRLIDVASRATGTNTKITAYACGKWK